MFINIILNLPILLQKILTPVLKITHSSPDSMDEYKKEFGSVGIQLHIAVCKARSTTIVQSTSNQTVTQTSKLICLNKILYIIMFVLYLIVNIKFHLYRYTI